MLAFGQTRQTARVVAVTSNKINGAKEIELKNITCRKTEWGMCLFHLLD
jgi:hypothetical protein